MNSKTAKIGTVLERDSYGHPTHYIAAGFSGLPHEGQPVEIRMEYTARDGIWDCNCTLVRFQDDPDFLSGVANG